jgi:hypothetical protein
MFFRIKKSGPRSDVQVVENNRRNGAVRQSVIANLGRADDLIASGALASLLASGVRLADQVLLINSLDDDSGSLTIDAKRIGGPLLFGKLWERLGIADVFEDLLRERAFVCGRTRPIIEEKLFDKRRDLFTDLLAVFMDTTSLSFCGDGEESLGENGYLKDYRAGLEANDPRSRGGWLGCAYLHGDVAR